MKRILGLDLGTNSIGWAVVNESENDNEQSSIERLGVRIVPLSPDEKSNIETGKAFSLNADRRMKRSMRRNLQRYKLRRKKLIDKLLHCGIINADTPLYERGNGMTFHTYRMRAKAVTERIELEDFARVLLMINKKRGYKSNRKVKESEEGELVDDMEVAKYLHDHNMTPGQYLYNHRGSQHKVSFYHSDLHLELTQIYDFQRSFHPEILIDKTFEDISGMSRTQTLKYFEKQHKIYAPKNSGKEAKELSLHWRADAVVRQLPIDQLVQVISDVNGSINSSSKRLSLISDRSKELYFNHETIGQHLLSILENDSNKSLTNIIFYRQDYIDEFNAIWDNQARYYPEILTPELKKEIGQETIFYQRNLKSSKHLINLCEFEHDDKEVEINGKKKTISIGSRACPKSSPIFQEFKVWQIINNIEVSVKGAPKRKKTNKYQPDHSSDHQDRRRLTPEEKQRLHAELQIHQKLSANEVLKLLFDDPRNLEINYNEVDGNRTMSSIYNAIEEILLQSGHGPYKFSAMHADDVNGIIEKIFSGLGWDSSILHFDPLLQGKAMEKQKSYKLWHLLYSYEGDNSKTGNEALIRKIMELCGFDRDSAMIMSQISFALDYGSLSAKAMRKILPHMINEGMEYSDACEKADYRHSERSLTREEIEHREYRDQLDLIRHNSLRSPVVEKILNHMINVVNAIVREYGRPDEIRIEMARELKKSREEREEMTRSIRKATIEAEQYKTILKRDFNIDIPTKNDVIRYRLYEELRNNGYKTLYSNTYISKEQLFSNSIDIEHIIPRARLFDDSYSNKTLEKRDVNIEKGNMTAFDFVKSKYGEEGLAKYRRTIEELYGSDVRYRGKKKKLLMSESEIPEDFLERDLRESQYIARKAKEILEQVSPSVVATTGSVTSRLREDWGLVDIMRELNWQKYEPLGMTHIDVDRNGNKKYRIDNWSKRNDHRHHAMDALTIAFTKSSIIQYLNNVNSRYTPTSEVYAIEKKEMERHDGKLIFKSPFRDNGRFRAEAKKHLSKILISIKAKGKVTTQHVNKTKKKGKNTMRKVQLTPRGQLHNETVYGRIIRYQVSECKIDGKMTEEAILCVTNSYYRKLLLERLSEYNGNPKAAFAGKNIIDKKPIWLDAEHKHEMPKTVKVKRATYIFTQRLAVDANLDANKVKKIIDDKTREIIEQRLNAYSNDPAKAFSDLENRPIYLNQEKGITIKHVKIQAKLSEGEAIREKRDVAGEIMRDKNNNKISTDYVSTASNHHAAIFRDKDGNIQERIVSFYEATARAMLGYPIIDREYNREEGWQFLFSMKKNEYFVFPDEENGFVPSEMDLTLRENYEKISKHLFRLRKFSKRDYVFSHHLDTSVDVDLKLKDITWKRITSLSGLDGIIKVRINHLGDICEVGE